MEADPPIPVPAESTPGPVARAERIVAVDVLRGFALLGILVMNVVAYALPDAAYTVPSAAGGFAGADRVAWLLSHVFFEFKMMTIFSMLFGAGLVLLAERAEERGADVRRIYRRRIGWLLVIGLVHAYLVWWGDILVAYAQCGVLIYFFRKRSPRALLVTGAAFCVVGALMMLGFGLFLGHARGAAQEVAAAQAAGRAPAPGKKEMADGWNDMRKELDPTPEEVRENAVVYHGSWHAIALHRAPKVIQMHTMAFLAFLLWRVGGTMLIGMGLMKLGVFSAARSDRFYGASMLVGFGLGFPLVAWGAWRLVSHDFDPLATMSGDFLPNYFGSFLAALGYVGLVMTAVRRRWLQGLQQRLAAVGQMALTNYLTQSLICTTLFYGYGFDLFERLSRWQLLPLCLAIWILQLAWSPWWLARYRYGPFEWSWRSLTYAELQSLRLAPGTSGRKAA
jgi:uncharacterized protein